jgi:hypothetical protein
MDKLPAITALPNVPLLFVTLKAFVSVYSGPDFANDAILLSNVDMELFLVATDDPRNIGRTLRCASEPDLEESISAIGMASEGTPKLCCSWFGMVISLKG